MLWADWTTFCCMSQLVTEGRLVPPLFFFLSLTYSCHCFDSCTIMAPLSPGHNWCTFWFIEALKPPNTPSESQASSMLRSLTTNLSLIIGSWHLFRGGEIDGGGGRGGLLIEPIHNDSQQRRFLLTFYKMGQIRFATCQRCCSFI